MVAGLFFFSDRPTNGPEPGVPTVPAGELVLRGRVKSARRGGMLAQTIAIVASILVDISLQASRTFSGSTYSIAIIDSRGLSARGERNVLVTALRHPSGYFVLTSPIKGTLGAESCEPDNGANTSTAQRSGLVSERCSKPCVKKLTYIRGLAKHQRQSFASFAFVSFAP